MVQRSRRSGERVDDHHHHLGSQIDSHALALAHKNYSRSEALPPYAPRNSRVCLERCFHHRGYHTRSSQANVAQVVDNFLQEEDFAPVEDIFRAHFLDPVYRNSQEVRVLVPVRIHRLGSTFSVAVGLEEGRGCGKQSCSVGRIHQDMIFFAFARRYCCSSVAGC